MNNDDSVYHSRIMVCIIYIFYFPGMEIFIKLKKKTDLSNHRTINNLLSLCSVCFIIHTIKYRYWSEHILLLTIRNDQRFTIMVTMMIIPLKDRVDREQAHNHE